MDLNQARWLMRFHLISYIGYYQEMKTLNLKREKILSAGVYSFILKLLSIYHDKSNKYFNISLVICLLRTFVSKMSWDKNTVYSTNFFNLYLALSKTSWKSFEFVLGDICGLGIRHIQIKSVMDGCSPFISLNE